MVNLKFIDSFKQIVADKVCGQCRFSKECYEQEGECLCDKVINKLNVLNIELGEL